MPAGGLLQVVGTDGAAAVGGAALDGGLEELVNLLGHGTHQLSVTTEAGFFDDFLDLGSNNNDFFGLLGHLFLPVARDSGKAGVAGWDTRDITAPDLA